MSLLEVKNIEIFLQKENRALVKGVSFSINSGEVLALVGESGAGKSLTSMSIPSLLPFPALQLKKGEILFKGKNIVGLKGEELLKIRQNEIAVVFQEPMSSLNPVLSIGYQLIEAIHEDISKEEKLLKAENLLLKLGIEDAKKRLKQYPHQFSGGMQQRVMIAIALLRKPALLIADEPTTALDVTVQREIMDILKNLIQENKEMSLLFVTHDLNLVQEIADKVCVMHEGVIKEEALVDDFFNHPKHPYSRTLLDSRPAKPDDKEIPGQKPREILVINDLNVSFINKRSLFAQNKYKSVLQKISLTINKNEVMGIVGESGSGKSTLARTIMGLCSWQGNTVIEGSITLHTDDKIYSLTGKTQKKLRPLRKHIQMVFQDPYSSLNPRMTVEEQLKEPLMYGVGSLTEKEAAAEITKILYDVGLKEEDKYLFPFQFSGGQRQRIAIARALITKPDILIADEPVSALDMSIQAQIISLLKGLKEKYSLTIIFIAHDLDVVHNISDRIIVMYKGDIVERGMASKVFKNPAHSYTKKLLASVPGR